MCNQKKSGKRVWGKFGVKCRDKNNFICTPNLKENTCLKMDLPLSNLPLNKLTEIEICLCSTKMFTSLMNQNNLSFEEKAKFRRLRTNYIIKVNILLLFYI